VFHSCCLDVLNNPSFQALLVIILHWSVSMNSATLLASLVELKDEWHSGLIIVNEYNIIGKIQGILH